MGRLVNGAAVIAACVAIFGAGETRSAVAATTVTPFGQQVITLDMQSRYVSQAEAEATLNSTTAPEAGPTGLRSWVILPQNYSSTRCYPVLYLLHAAGTVEEWADEAALYAGLQAIVVVPGGGDSQYTNWWDGGSRRPGWELWFFNELLPQIQHTLPVCTQRSMHAIAGSSMGGYGAMFLAAEDPGYFGTVASFSGSIAISNPVIQYNYDAYTGVWGPIDGFYATGHDPTSLVKNLAHTRIFVYVGNGQPASPDDSDTGDEALIEGVMRSAAMSFMQAASRAHVAVEFVEHNGIHDQLNWNVSLTDFLAANPFGSATSSPSNWTYTTVAQSGTAWDWTYRFHQPPDALETLTEHGATLRGSGSGTVTMVGPNGQHFTTGMPFVMRNGRVRSLAGSSTSTTTARPLPATITLNPSTIHRARPLRITFTPHVRLRSDEEYELDAYQHLSTCIDQHAVHFHPKSHRISYTFPLFPGDGRGHPKGRWCAGGGMLALEVVPRNHAAGTQVGRLIGHADFDAASRF
jgi:S-formylglutathione hydrolase FrmB